LVTLSAIPGRERYTGCLAAKSLTLELTKAEQGGPVNSSTSTKQAYNSTPGIEGFTPRYIGHS
jgi:hypothetical protein